MYCMLFIYSWTSCFERILSGSFALYLSHQINIVGQANTRLASFKRTRRDGYTWKTKSASVCTVKAIFSLKIWCRLRHARRGRQLAIKNWLLLLPSSEINNSMSLNELDPLFLYMFTREDSHFCVTPTFISKLVISLSLHWVQALTSWVTWHRLHSFLLANTSGSL